jgi:hypothetical protein
VVNGSPTEEPSPAIHSQPSGHGKPVAVIQASPKRRVSATSTAATLCSLCSTLGSVSPSESKVMSCKVSPSSPMHSPVCRANATMTSMLARGSSNAVAACLDTRTAPQKLVIDILVIIISL